MKKFSKILAIGFAFGVLAMLLSLIPNHPVRAQGLSISPILPILPAQNVNVLNNPLPVKVLNTPLPVTGNVVLSGNAAAAPLFVQDVDAPDRQPFASACPATLTRSNDTLCTILVPAGVEWAIQTVSIYGVSDSTNKNVEFNLSVVTKSLPQYHFHNLQDNGINQTGNPATGASELVGTFSNTIRADPGSTISCSWNTGLSNNPNSGLVGNCSIQGYYVTLP